MGVVATPATPTLGVAAAQGARSGGDSGSRERRRSIRARHTPSSSSLSSSSTADVGGDSVRPRLAFEVRRLRGSADVEAAAWVRAVSFHRCPPGREYSGRMFQATKAAEEGEGLALRVRGADPWYGRVQTLLATAGLADALRSCGLVECVVGGVGGAEVRLEHADAALNAEAGGFVVPPACLIPAEAPPGRRGGGGGSGGGGSGGVGIEVVLGSLDVNLGQALAGEWLTGDLPRDDGGDGGGGGDSGDGGDRGGAGGSGRRVYLSNVCALPAAQRRGIAQALVEDALLVAAEWGVDDVYVHAVAENLAARALYERLGFVLVKEETQALAARLKRPRRVLFHRATHRSRRGDDE